MAQSKKRMCGVGVGVRAWMGADAEGRQWLRFLNPASQPLGLSIIARDGHVPVYANHCTN